jgi:hypothetical protein
MVYLCYKHVLVNIKETYYSKLGRFNMGLIVKKEYGLFYLLELSRYLLTKYSCRTHDIRMHDIAPCPQTDQM